jgi:hypothetical protein
MERKNLSCYLEEDSLLPPHGISLADAAYLKVLFQTEGALAMGVARDTGCVTRCPHGDGELRRGDPTDDRRLTPLVREEEKRAEEEEEEVE